jgi:Tol biopolymer transport system component
MSREILYKSISRQKNVILLLTTFLLLNPLILYIVSKSIIFSLLLPIATSALLLYIYNSTKYKIATTYFFNLVFIMAVFITAEAIFNSNFNEFNVENLYSIKKNYYFNQPYLDKVFNDKEFTVNYKTNKQGLRIGFEDDPKVEIEQVDWLFIGDSYTQGAQVQFEDLYSTILNDSLPNKIIVNAGISGFGLPDEYNYYISEGRKLKPNKVFLQICNFNDFMNVVEKEPGFSDYLMEYSNFARFLLYGFKYANPAELPLGRWTEPFYPDEESNKNYNIFYKVSSPSKEKDLIKFKAYLSKINQEVTKDGAQLIVLQIPTKEQIYYKFFEEVVQSFNIDITKLDMNLPNKILREECEKLGVELIDLSDAFTSSEYEVYYQYDEHLNSHGHLAVTREILNHLNNDSLASKKNIFLSKNNAGDRYPNFLQDSTHLSYQSMRDGNMELFISDKDLTNSRRITFNKVDEIHPWVSPDGNKVVFTEESLDRTLSKIVIMNLDGSDRKHLTNGNDTFGAIASFNKIGTSLAYAEWRTNQSGNYSNPYIVVLDLAKGTKKAVTLDSSESWRPVFSPVGNHIYFISKAENKKFDIYSLNLNTNKRINLTNSDYDEWDPAISNDGRYLAYAGKKDENWDLFILDLVDGTRKQLTQTKGNEWDPCFSPNGRELYFAGTFGFKNGIYKMAL